MSFVTSEDGMKKVLCCLWSESVLVFLFSLFFPLHMKRQQDLVEKSSSTNDISNADDLFLPGEISPEQRDVLNEMPPSNAAPAAAASPNQPHQPRRRLPRQGYNARPQNFYPAGGGNVFILPTPMAAAAAAGAAGYGYGLPQGVGLCQGCSKVFPQVRICAYVMSLMSH